MNLEQCPSCHTSLIGEPIAPEHLEHKPNHDEQVAEYGRCFCRPYGDSTHFRREMGFEISEVYDGVLYWGCPDCGLAWPRDFGNWESHNKLSIHYANEANAALGEGGEAAKDEADYHLLTRPVTIDTVQSWTERQRGRKNL